MITIECSGGCGKVKKAFPSRIKNDKWVCKECTYKDPNVILRMSERNKNSALKRKNRGEHKETHTCMGGCGKSKTAFPSYFKRGKYLRQGGWMCLQCSNKDRGVLNKRKRDSKMETRVCYGGCGKSRTDYSWYFEKYSYNGNWLCHSCRMKKVAKSKRTKSEETRVCSGGCGKIKTQSYYKFKRQDGKWYCKECWSKNQTDRKPPVVTKSITSESREKMGVSQRKRFEDVEERERIRNKVLQLFKDPEYYENYLIGQTGEGFWYGHITLKKQNNGREDRYCEVFQEVKPRVRAFFNHICTKCGKLESGEAHHVHHIFYEKKTCCWISNDGNYWTNLNIKNHERDYYIGENPNYFALLCGSCHSSTNGGYDNRKNSANELRKTIDEKYSGKSYYTEEEMVNLGYTKISKTKWKINNLF